MKISVGAAISAAAVTAAVTVTLTYTYAMNRFNAKVADVNERQAMYEKLAEIDDKTRQDYVGTIDEQSVTDGMCAGYLAGLGDSHTKYLTAKEYKVYRDSAEALSTGVGISTVRDSDGNMEVVEVVPDSPAEKAGIKKGDTIIQADGKDVVRITYASAIQLLDGTAGTTVTFRLLRVVQAAPAASEDTSSDTDSAAGAAETQTIDVTVTRGEYSKTTVTSSMINGNVAYLRISQFADGTVEDFNAALASLVNQGACGVVVDLRGNTGGSMQVAASVLDTLLPAGTTVKSRDKDQLVTTEFTSGANEVSLPVSVLVNDETSGAAELFALDIRDFQKGLVVGETTAGNGLKETVVPLSDGSAVILSTAEYLSASGTVYEQAGVVPDIQKELTEEQKNLLERRDLMPSEDAQVQTSVTALARQGALVKEAPGASSSVPAEETAKD